MARLEIVGRCKFIVFKDFENKEYPELRRYSHGVWMRRVDRQWADELEDEELEKEYKRQVEVGLCDDIDDWP